MGTYDINCFDISLQILFVLTTTQDNKYQRTCNGVPHHHLDQGADEEMAYAPLYTDDPKWSRQRRMIQTE